MQITPANFDAIGDFSQTALAQNPVALERFVGLFADAFHGGFFKLVHAEFCKDRNHGLVCVIERLAGTAGLEAGAAGTLQ